jgi:hypothetical protein
MSDFKVFVRFPVGTPAEWGTVLSTPVDRLPSLTPEQSDRARRWGISTEDERRNVLRQRLAEERLEAEGLKLGKAVQQVLEDLDAPGSYQLRAIVIDGGTDSWTLRIETPQGIKDFGIEGTLRKRIVGNAAAHDQHGLRRELLSVLGRADLLAVH